ncbi:MAG: hypothetical protein P1U58_01495 [Verrucomicrobiales bacterium]|nr:hypothetical protein [Verrucomicrobiales bacterium]
MQVIVTMFVGRIGPVTIGVALLSEVAPVADDDPAEQEIEDVIV